MTYKLIEFAYIDGFEYENEINGVSTLEGSTEAIDTRSNMLDEIIDDYIERAESDGETKVRKECCYVRYEIYLIK